MHSSSARKENLTGFLLIAPFMVVFLIFLAYPMVMSLSISLKKVTLTTGWFDVFGQMEYCGLENYQRLFTSDQDFWFALVLTAYYAILTIPVGIALSLSLAIMLSNKLRGVFFYRTAFFLPNVLDPLVVGILWVIILAPDFGLVEVALSRMLGVFGVETGGSLVPLGFLGNPWTCLPVIAFVMILKSAGFGMILFLTAIQNIPQDLYEAADLDGANHWQQLRHITLPQVKPIILFLVITGMMNSMNAFTEIYAMTNGTGGPTMTFMGETVKSGNLAGFLLFKTFLSGDYGYAAAMAFSLMGIALVVSWISMRVLGEEA